MTRRSQPWWWADPTTRGAQKGGSRLVESGGHHVRVRVSVKVEVRVRVRARVRVRVRLRLRVRARVRVRVLPVDLRAGRLCTTRAAVGESERLVRVRFGVGVTVVSDCWG